MTVAEHSMLQLVGDDGTAEFNVDPDEATFKLTIGKETRRFKIVDLWAITYAIAGADQQDKMMPVKQTEVLTYRRIHNYKLKKAQPAGAVLRIPCEINVEKSVVEGLKGMVEQQKKDLTTGVPIIGQK